ncbi:MAG TPA: energy transducer TonB [Burkholderiales bacterium]|jgi:protein TonB|nr:energy transducer TonB [Burkholderiales bacterium]
MRTAPRAIRVDYWLTITLVSAIHVAVGYGLWQTARQVVTPAVSTQPLLVELLAPRPATPPTMPVSPAPPPPEKIEPITPPQPAVSPQPVVREMPQPKPQKQHQKHHSRPIRKAARKPPPAVEHKTPLQSVDSPTPAAVQPVPPAPPTAAAAEPATPPVVRVPVNYNADYLRNPAPAYPVLARRLGHAGKVLLRVLVDGGGRPQKVEIKKSSGYQRLDQSALDAVRKWRFVPAREADHAVASWVTIPIIFKLQG